MGELFQQALQPIQLPWTTLLGLCLGYWILVLTGLLDLDSHGDATTLVDPHGPLNADADASIDAGEVHGLIKPLAQFFNLGEVPLVVTVSFFALFGWLLSMSLNLILNPWNSGLLGLALLAPTMLAAGLATRHATKPIGKFFRMLNYQGETHKPVVGRSCVIMTTEATPTFGQAQVDQEGAPLLINVRTFGDLVLKKGDPALIIKHDAETGVYTVANLESPTTQAAPAATA